MESTSTPAAPRSEGPSTRTASIRATSLCRSYGDHVAVHDVSFHVSPGEVFGLLGPNGAGKTTLLRMLAGILPPSKGRAEIGGVDVSVDPEAVKRRLGFLSGDTALYARLSVQEVLRYFAQLHRLPPAVASARITAVCQDLDITDLLERRCGSLSSGQNQRVNLARAFLADPEALILDEPTVGLDVVSGRFVIEAIDRARDGGKAVLLSTHIMSEVDELCDRIGLLARGRLRACGTREELLDAYGVKSLREAIVMIHEGEAEP